LPKRAIAGTIASLFTLVAIPAHAAECSDLWDWLDKGCRRVVDTYEHGGNELFLSGYSYHIPGTWTPERRAELNSNAWGAGLGRTVEEPNGDTHTVFFYGFEDSHRNAQLQAGYAWTTFWGPRDGVQLGLGYTALIVQRPDLLNGFPFPAVLPIASVRVQKATMVMTYIPTLNGGINHGSTLYIMGRFALY
jgi:palmitoyl transferase